MKPFSPSNDKRRSRPSVQLLLLSLLTLLFLAYPLVPLFSQITEDGIDLLGKPHKPLIGLLPHEIRHGVPAEEGNRIANSFAAGIGGKSWSTPYSIIRKNDLEKAGALSQSGATREELRRTHYWATVGCQYLFRVEVNSWELADHRDSIYNKEGKFIKTAMKKTASANLTARLTDVATSKILIYKNYTFTATKETRPGMRSHYDSKELTDIICQHATFKAKTIVSKFIPATSEIKSIHELKKSKAISVLLNPVTPTISCEKGTRFNVYSMPKIYEKEGERFPHAKYIGRIEKAPDYTYKFNKFEVKRGKKEIAEKFKSGTPLIASRGVFPLVAMKPSPARTSLVFDNFTNATPASQANVRILQDGCIEVFANRSQLIDVVDREIYDLIKKEQSIQSATMSDATQAGIDIGGEFVITAEVVEYKNSVKVERKVVTPEEKKGANKKPAPTENSKKGTAPAKEEKKAPSAKPKVTFGKSIPVAFVYNTTIAVNVKVISVETGEMVFSKPYSVGGTTKVPIAEKDSYSTVRAKENNFRTAAGHLASWVWADLFYLVTPRLHLLDVLETEKGKVKSVLIGGGKQAGIAEGHQIEIVEPAEEMVDGQRLSREILIAELKVKRLHPATSVCTVKNGGDTLQEKLSSGAKLFCRLKKASQ